MTVCYRSFEESHAVSKSNTISLFGIRAVGEDGKVLLHIRDVCTDLELISGLCS